MATKEQRAVMNLATCLGLTLYRFCQCAFYGPATLQSLVKRLYRHARFFCPCRHALRSTIKFNETVSSCVSTLLSWRCPATVVRLVASVVVGVSIKCCFDWPWSHVLQECFKRISPPVANCYSTFAVVAIFAIGGAVAASEHCIPAFVFSRTCHAVSGEGYLCCTSSTPLRFVPADLRGSHGALIPARALAEPLTLRCRCFFNEANNNPCFAKHFSCQVFKVVGAANRISLSHLTVPRILDVVRAAWRHESSGCSHFSTLAAREQR